MYVSLKNDSGKEIYRLAVRTDSPNARSLTLNPNGTNSFSWGSFDALSGSYNATVTVQLSTGERPTVFTGTVTFE